MAISLHVEKDAVKITRHDGKGVELGLAGTEWLLNALLQERGYEKRWAIAKPDGSIELVDGEDPVAAADLVPSWRAVEIYVPVQGEGE